MTLLLGVLAASLIGSVHCAAMCGSFVCLYAGTARPGDRSLSAHLAYNGGRLVSYLTLGLIAGAIGARVDQLGTVAGVTRAAAITAGALMVAWAISVLASSVGVRPVGVGAPACVKRVFGTALMRLRDRSPTTRAAATGLLTTLLPCGWLYTFVITAAGTGHALTGAAVMIVFWAGTVPMLLSIGLGVQRFGRPLLQRLPMASAALVLVLGVLSIAGRLEPLHSVSPSVHHGAAGHVGR